MGLAAARQTPCSTFAQLGAAAGGAGDAGDDNSRAKSAADIALDEAARARRSRVEGHRSAATLVSTGATRSETQYEMEGLEDDEEISPPQGTAQDSKKRLRLSPLFASFAVKADLSRFPFRPFFTGTSFELALASDVLVSLVSGSQLVCLGIVSLCVF